jgi:hypothetical protein
VLRTGKLHTAVATRQRDAWASRDKNKSPPPVCDACETTLNPGFKWERLDAFGLSAARRTCTPGFRCAPMVVIKGQGECLRRLSRTAEDVRKL